MKIFIKAACLIFLLLLTPPPVNAESDDLHITYIAACDENFPPYEFRDENGLPSGYDIDILNAVSDEMGLEIKIVCMPWNEAIKEFESGNVDLLAGMFYSEKRENYTDFSIPYNVVSHSAFIRTSSPDINSPEDLRNKKIIVQSGDIMHEYLLNTNLTANIIVVESPLEALKLLSSGSHDAALISKLQGLYLTDKYNIENIRSTGPLIKTPKYSFAVKKGNRVLLGELNEGLYILENSGKSDEIYEKWFGVYEQKSQFEEVIKILFWIITPFIVLLGVLFLWSATLKRKINEKTAELLKELEERKKADIALKESEKKYREVFNNVTEGIFLNEFEDGKHTGKVIEVNDIACRRLGYSRDEILSMPAKDIQDLGILPEAGSVGETLNNGYASYETMAKRKDGSTYPVNINSRIFELNGRNVVISLVRDITQEKESQKREAKALRQIEKNLNQLAILNDHIRNPLAAIVGYADLEDGKYSDNIINQAEEIDKIIYRLDRGWLESEKISAFLKKYYSIDSEKNNEENE
ncbi:transporter substrate-binding domain-containing protein [Methanoplanus sp. FWC-SCC4]|uniref:Transporter substrate-binding domain-containing protein n=1 Tax=Methanochimaera problematica TaxID=2609417 RepID=A0AA97FBS6_9EURY|nr:transporter substrate-binding domain-containing protein [Methanoplanus sp. FWC-SCC4]WOF15348.1 transporter substrate-binding domain-containing protein [Methanoplanus sp. FWC-SCC4]